MRTRLRTFLGSAAVALAASSTATAAEIVYDPANLAANLQQVAHHLELIARLDEQIRLQWQALENWEFTRLEELLEGFESLREPFELDSAYQTDDPAALIEQSYSLSLSTDESLDALRRDWIALERAALVNARVVQNRVVEEVGAAQSRVAEYVTRSNAAPGPTAATQAGNEILATLIEQLMALSALELSAGRAELEQEAAQQAARAYQAALRAQLHRPLVPSTAIPAGGGVR